jgi:hypothetical protein
MRTGGPVNSTFKGSGRSWLFTAFALGDQLPGIAVAPARAARQIVDACARKRALLLVGVSARVYATLFGLLPGVMTRVLASAASLLPQSFTRTGARGGAIARELGRAGQAVAQRSRAKHNQPPIDAHAVEADDTRAPTAEEIALAQAAAGISE